MPRRDAGRAVVPLEADRDRAVVPAVVVRPPVGGRAYRRRGRVAPDDDVTVIARCRPTRAGHRGPAGVARDRHAQPLVTPAAPRHGDVLVCQALQSAGPGEQLGLGSRRERRGRAPERERERTSRGGRTRGSLVASCPRPPRSSPARTAGCSSPARARRAPGPPAPVEARSWKPRPPQPQERRPNSSSSSSWAPS